MCLHLPEARRHHQMLVIRSRDHEATFDREYLPLDGLGHNPTTTANLEILNRIGRSVGNILIYVIHDICSTINALVGIEDDGTQ
jgi:hypothetical protein